MGWKNWSYWLKSVSIIGILIAIYLVFITLDEYFQGYILIYLPLIIVDYLFYIPLYLVVLILNIGIFYTSLYQTNDLFIPHITPLGWIISIIIWFFILWLLFFIMGKIKDSDRLKIKNKK